jgi:hypothetical protein
MSPAVAPVAATSAAAVASTSESASISSRAAGLGIRVLGAIALLLTLSTAHAPGVPQQNERLDPEVIEDSKQR